MKTEIEKLIQTFKGFGIAFNEVAKRLEELGIELNIYETIEDQNHRTECAFWAKMLHDLKSDPSSNPRAVAMVWDKFKRI